MTEGRLILAPLDPDQRVSLEQLVLGLQELDLCGEALPGRPGAYAAGQRFLQWISFAGCSAFVRMEPQSPEDQAFCHLRLLAATSARPRFLAGRSTRAPRCSHCGTGIAQWRGLMEGWSAGAGLACPQCGQTLDPRQLSWRKSAGLAMNLVEVWNVFPGEARPVSLLFDELRRLSGTDWRYFFLD